ncbi:MAG TPA: cytochrome d ubiquinol oxidase subunit II [Steroidobacteraceae bacterium]|nr:cytochrome d ubiquinol oxidase subunit II [Steroidobacteraceae bacterium]
MIDYEALRVIWWLLLGALLIGFAVTDGFDLGVGTIFRFVGRGEAERRALLESVEPVWEGNQVWFILGGGAVFAAWPLLYAASFSNLYLAMFLVLIALILRPVGFSFRNRIADARWRKLWDWALFVGGAVPALLFGVAFGNLFLGVAFHFDALMRPVYSGDFLHLLQPFALLAGLVSLAMLTLHGASYAALKVADPMASRASAAGRAAAIAFVILFVAAGAWVAFGIDGQRIAGGADPLAPSDPLAKVVTVARGAWLGNYRSHALLWLVPAVAVLAAAAAGALLGARRAAAAFVCSAVTQAATILTAGIALYPFLMPSSTNPGQGLTIWDASSSAKTLRIMLVAVIVFLPIVLAYTAWVFRVLRGRITLESLARDDGPY